ncbi:hypothetical protein B4113_1665 [Geobacillus sp. B4113_201601]|nr:hypothetical protein B4113_1665 [Geobacillus sp. B4113_201601]
MKQQKDERLTRRTRSFYRTYEGLKLHLLSIETRLYYVFIVPMRD